MTIKSVLLTVILLVFSINTNAALIDKGIYTTDTSSGLDWLDLTETSGLSYRNVSSELGAGGIYDGWVYATSSQVVTLWSNFSIDLQSGASVIVSVGLDSNLEFASTLLGNTRCLDNCLDTPFGTMGITETFGPASHPSGYRKVLGVTYFGVNDTTFYTIDDFQSFSPNGSVTWAGSYLVRPSIVPVPASIWLFGSGFLYLVSIVRRKKL